MHTVKAYLYESTNETRSRNLKITFITRSLYQSKSPGTTSSKFARSLSPILSGETSSRIVPFKSGSYDRSAAYRLTSSLQSGCVKTAINVLKDI